MNNIKTHTDSHRDSLLNIRAHAKTDLVVIRHKSDTSIKNMLYDLKCEVYQMMAILGPTSQSKQRNAERTR